MFSDEPLLAINTPLGLALLIVTATIITTIRDVQMVLSIDVAKIKEV